MSSVNHPRPARDAHAGVSRDRVVIWFLAALGGACAVIHLGVAGAHFQLWWVFGVLMLGAASLQLLWAVAAALWPAALFLIAGILLNGGIVCVYVITRTVGYVVGPYPHAVETVGFEDAYCTLLEVIVVLGCGWLLFARSRERVSGGGVLATLSTIGAVVAFLLSVSLVAGGPQMVMGTADSGSMAMGPAPSVRIPTGTPAGPITMPDPNLQMGSGMRMASSTSCDTPPSRTQRESAVKLVDQSWSGARRYRRLAVAKAAGYRPVTPSGRRVVHYINPASYRAAAEGGPVLDPAAPQSLVYANTPNGAVLVAAMYISPDGVTPRPGGCLTQWHVHTNLCLAPGPQVVAQLGAGTSRCPAGSQNLVTPPMLHIWFVPIAGGPTAIDAPDAAIVRAAERVSSPPNGTA